MFLGDAVFGFTCAVKKWRWFVVIPVGKNGERADYLLFPLRHTSIFCPNNDRRNSDIGESHEQTHMGGRAAHNLEFRLGSGPDFWGIRSRRRYLWYRNRDIELEMDIIFRCRSRCRDTIAKLEVMGRLADHRHGVFKLFHTLGLVVTSTDTLELISRFVWIMVEVFMVEEVFILDICKRPIKLANIYYPYLLSTNVFNS